MTTAIDLEKLADTWEPRLRDAFIQAIEEAANRIDIAALARLLEKGDITGALRMIGLDPANFSQFALTHAQIFNAGGTATAQSIPPVRQAGGYYIHVLFNARSLGAELWARNVSATMIQEIIDDQRTVIRGFLEQGLAAGANPRTTALDLVGRIDPRTRQRVGGVIGLHSIQEQWLANYARDLASDDPAALKALLGRQLRDKRFDRTILKAIKNGTDIPADIQVKMRVSYANRLLKFRADNIARTETMRALGAGQTEAYQQAIDRNEIDQSLITRFPVTAGDERVRPTHREVPGMNKEGRKWNEPFQTPFGPQMHAPYPTEVNCRCHERIVVNFLKKGADKLKEMQRRGEITLPESV